MRGRPRSPPWRFRTNFRRHDATRHLQKLAHEQPWRQAETSEGLRRTGRDGEEGIRASAWATVNAARCQRSASAHAGPNQSRRAGRPQRPSASRRAPRRQRLRRAAAAQRGSGPAPVRSQRLVRTASRPARRSQPPRSRPTKSPPRQAAPRSFGHLKTAARSTCPQGGTAPSATATRCEVLAHDLRSRQPARQARRAPHSMRALRDVVRDQCRGIAGRAPTRRRSGTSARQVSTKDLWR